MTNFWVHLWLEQWTHVLCYQKSKVTFWLCKCAVTHFNCNWNKLSDRTFHNFCCSDKIQICYCLIPMRVVASFHYVASGIIFINFFIVSFCSIASEMVEFSVRQSCVVMLPKWSQKYKNILLLYWWNKLQKDGTWVMKGIL